MDACGGVGMVRRVCNRHWLLKSPLGLHRRERGHIGGLSEGSGRLGEGDVGTGDDGVRQSLMLRLL